MRERAGWLLRDALTTLALILAEKEEVSRLERAINATWLDLEADRRDRFVAVSHRASLVTPSRVKKGVGEGNGACHGYYPDPVGVIDLGEGMSWMGKCLHAPNRTILAVRGTPDSSKKAKEGNTRRVSFAMK